MLNLEVVTKRLLYWQVTNNTRVALVPCHTWECVHTAISCGVDISTIPGCHLLSQMSSWCGSQKLLQGLVSHELTAYLSDIDPFLSQ